ncbi:unnamed protein product, partial [Brassica rapa subsp. trilocularis]
MATSILLFYLLLVLPCFVDSVSFNFTSFQRGDPGNVIYHGDASLDGAVVLGNTGYTSRVGWVTYAEKVPIWNSRTENSSLSYIIDLATVLPPQVTIGFSATTGAVTEGHRLLSWEFSSSLDSEKASIRTGLIVGFSISGFFNMEQAECLIIVGL